MYVVVRNQANVIPHSLNKSTWKYLDECQEFAKQQLKPGDTIEVCELTPKTIYTYELSAEEVPEHVCSPLTPGEEESGDNEEENPEKKEDETSNKDETPREEVNVPLPTPTDPEQEQ